MEDTNKEINEDRKIERKRNYVTEGERKKISNADEREERNNERKKGGREEGKNLRTRKGGMEEGRGERKKLRKS